MIRKLKTAAFILVNLLLLPTVSGQNAKNMTENLSQKLLNYTVSVPREEIYVHSDREEYISGEDMWFNAYLIDRNSMKPSTGSKIAYVELLNPDNRPILQKRVLLNGGSGPGQFVIPDTLSTGIYTLRAYTSWMKNFLPSNCFSRDIRIYNSFTNRVLKGKIKSAKTSSTAIPSFLPNSGLSMKVDNLKRDFLDLQVTSTEKYRTDNNFLLYLLIQTHGVTNYVSTEMIREDLTKISIPKWMLAPGINQITVFNLNGQPVGERFIYTPDIDNAVLTVSAADSSSARSKISIGLDFGKLAGSDINLSNLSVSVAPVNTDVTSSALKDYMVFGTEFGVDPDKLLKGTSPDKIPAAVMDSILMNVKSNWINWNVIITNQVPVFRYQMETDDHFLSGRLMDNDLKAGVADKFVLLTVPGKTAVFEYARTAADGFFSFKLNIDEKIKDLVIVPDVVVKNQSVVLQSSFSDQYYKAEGASDSLIKAVPDYVSALSVNHQVRKIFGSTSVGEPIKRGIVTPSVRRFYGKPDNELIMKDFIILPVMQEVFFELLQGISLKSKKAGYEITVANPESNKPYDVPPGLFIDGVAVKDAGLIAGLDPELVEKIDVVRERYYVGDYTFYGIVNVITKSGDFSNVLLPDYTIRLPYRVIDPVNSFTAPDFSSDKLKKSRIPDFRNTLYWNPSVKPDKNGKANIEFWTSDYLTDFEVNVQGVTSDGKICSLKKTIRVK